MVGVILRNLRGQKTQEQVATDIGVSKSALAMYERDERTPRDEIKVRLAGYYGKTVQEIFFSHNEHI